MQHPKIGERVKVRPRPGHNVQVDGIFGRFLAAAGEEVTYSYWYHERLLDGSITIDPPAATEVPEHIEQETTAPGTEE